MVDILHTLQAIEEGVIIATVGQCNKLVQEGDPEVGGVAVTPALRFRLHDNLDAVIG